VAGLGIRLYLDEMFSGRVALALRRQGYDIESCYDAGLGGQRVSDDQRLAFAAQQGRAILTCNARDFVPLDRRYKADGREHAGILLSPWIDDLGEIIRCVQRHLDEVRPETQWNTLLWLDSSTTTG
jgi:uncharacterized protein DUF5615